MTTTANRIATDWLTQEGYTGHTAAIAARGIRAVIATAETKGRTAALSRAAGLTSRPGIVRDFLAAHPTLGL